MILFSRHRRHDAGFTLLEIMVVILIMSLILAIAIPNFLKARETSRARSCVKNLRAVCDAKEQYAMQNSMTSGDAVDWEDLVPNYLKSQPECPSGGGYALNSVGEDPTCTYPGHAL